MGRVAVVLASAITSIFCSNALAAGPFGTIHVGTWKGGAFTNDSTGAFAHCVVGSDYASGVGLLIGQASDHSWILGFTSGGWNLTQGTTIPIDIVLDGQTQFRIF